MTIEELKNEISNRVVVVDFMATRCGPCQIMYPVVKEIADQYDAKFIKLNADEHPELFEHYEVYGVPHIKVFVDGVEKAESTGPKQRAELEEMLLSCVSTLDQPVTEKQEAFDYAVYF